MKIDEKIISIPPYISTTWEHVSSLKMESGDLVFSLIDDSVVKIPNLEDSTVQLAFQAHIKYIEKYENEDGEKQIKQETPKANTPLSQISSLFNAENAIGFPIRLGSEGMEGLGTVMQHNPSQKNMPKLPSEILSKISAIAKVIGSEETIPFPEAEANCNCMHCQIARAIRGEESEQNEEILDEEVTDEDLKFREWDIEQTNGQIYTVSNPLDAEEHYSVYLGSPVGCTCGKKNCEHIKAVLKS